MQAIKFVKFLCAISLFGIVAFLCACGEKTPAEIEQINKKKAELAVRRAQVMSAEGKTKDAIKMLETAYQECGARANICEALANAFIADGQTASAGIFYEQAFDCDNEKIDLLIFAANAYEQTDSLDAAIKVYEKFLKKSPNNITATKAIAKIHEKQGNFDKALNAYLDALKTSKRNPDTTEATIIGGLFAKLGNMTQAKLWLEASLKASLPENIKTRTEIYVNLIDVYLARKDMANLEKTIAALDAIDKKIVNEKYPTLKAKLAEFKHNLAEVEAELNAEKRRNEIEKEQLQAETKKDEPKKVAQPEANPIDKKQAQPTTDDKNAKIENPPASTENKDAKTEDKSEKKEEKTENAPKENQLNEVAKVTEKNVVTPPKKEETELQAYIRKAREAINKGDLKNAIAQANQAISKNSQSPEAWRAMAEALLANKLYNDAYLAANEAYLINPENLENAILLLQTAQKDKDENKFLNIAQSFWEKFSTSADVAFFLAQAHDVLKNDAQAISFYKKALELGLQNLDKIKIAEQRLKR